MSMVAITPWAAPEDCSISLNNANTLLPESRTSERSVPATCLPNK
jgi:hypothetical protein